MTFICLLNWVNSTLNINISWKNCILKVLSHNMTNDSKNVIEMTYGTNNKQRGHWNIDRKGNTEIGILKKVWEDAWQH